jgi:hypothetical protein
MPYEAYEALLDLFDNAPAFKIFDRPILWLGAGASLHDGMPIGEQLVIDIVESRRPGSWGSPQHRLDRFFETLTPPQRLAILQPHFDRPLTPDSPYHTVVKLLLTGRVGAVVTFNVDDLLRDAIIAAGAAREIEVIDAVDMTATALAARMAAPQQKGPVVMKLHGGLASGLNLFTSMEIAQYWPEVEGLVTEVSCRPAIVCGYSFAHLNVLRAFSTDPGALFYCNPRPPTSAALLSLMEKRGGVRARCIDEDDGRFDVLMAALARDLALPA